MNLTFMIFEVSKQLPRSKNLTMAINKLHYGHMTRDTMSGMMTSDVPDNLWSCYQLPVKIRVFTDVFYAVEQKPIQKTH